MKIVLPEKVTYIIDTLTQHGFEAYAVGGCVRDTMLGRIPMDWDITTSAKPEQVKELFRHTIDTGIQHGTVTVMLEHEGFEVTTYRIDGEYADARHPKEVQFSNWINNHELYKQNRKECNSDYESFQDEVYKLQDSMLPLAETL